jgi:drug/metabolite transporter (DMT)-like permease
MVLAATLGAALCYAVASVLQHQAATAEPPQLSLRPSLLLKLLRRPRWLIGVGADIVAFALQVVALDRGSLVLVQPLLVSGLLFALPLGAILEGRRMRATEWLGAAELAVGLSVFLVIARPQTGSPETSGLGWGIVLAATLLPAAVMVALSGPPGPRRAMMLGAATGLLYGLTAALTKGTANLVDDGLLQALGHWEPYALVAIGLAGMLTAQSAFQAAPLGSSLPLLTAVDPVASILIGALAFREGLTTTGGAPVVEVLSLAVMVAGIVNLARCQVAPDESASATEPDDGERHGRPDQALQE